MPTKTVTFRAPEDSISRLDAIAAFQHRDRSFLINEAVENYLSLDDYHRELILEGLRQVDAEETLDHEEVVKMAGKWSGDAKRKKK